MYHMKPFHQFDGSASTTDCMYKMKKICSSNGAPANDMDSAVSQAVQDVIRRQDQIIAKLEALKSEVESMTLATSSNQAKTAAQSVERNGKTNFPKDLVIACNPAHKPTVLLEFLLSLQKRHNVLLVEYMHSSARSTKPMDLSLFGFVRGSRATSSMVVSWIWKKCEGQCEMMVSPIRQTKIQGEVNICRYLMRVAGEEVNTAPVNYWLDIADNLLRSHDLKKSLACLAEYLSKNKCLSGSTPSTTDLIVKLALKQAATASTDTKQVSNSNASIQRWLHS